MKTKFYLFWFELHINNSNEADKVITSLKETIFPYGGKQISQLVFFVKLDFSHYCSLANEIKSIQNKNKKIEIFCAEITKESYENSFVVS